MKRAVLLLSVGLLATPERAAAEVRAGAWAGPNIASLDIEHVSEADRESRTALAVGAVVAWRPGPAWSLELRPSYVGRGSKVRIQGASASIEAWLWEFPLLLTRDLGAGRVRPYLLAGGALGHLSSAKAVFGASEQDILDDFERTDLSLRAGAGARLFAVAGQPFVEVEYTHGLSDANSNGQGLGQDVGAIRNRGIQIRGGFSFGLK